MWKLALVLKCRLQSSQWIIVAYLLLRVPLERTELAFLGAGRGEGGERLRSYLREAFLGGLRIWRRGVVGGVGEGLGLGFLGVMQRVAE